ncbi:MAG: glycosyltransferase [Armatimonadota bacterium]
MRITVITAGSRGDVQPYIALSHGLHQAGHAVRLATHDEFAPLVEGRGLELFPMGGNPRDLLETRAAEIMLGAGGNPLRFVTQFSRLVVPFLQEFMAESIRASDGAEVILFSGTGLLVGYHIAEKLGVPFVMAPLQPALPTRAFPSSFFPEYPAWLPGRGAYNWLSHVALAQLFWQFFGKHSNALRAEMGLPRIAHREAIRRAGRYPVLFGVSPSVVPPPADWPANAHLTGYWFLDRSPLWQPPAALADFLAAGPKPVYIGFGSMKNSDPEATTGLVLRALERTGQRGILFTGWGGMRREDLPEYAFAIDSTPHDWLLPQMSAALTHGGAGTTAAILRAGIPCIVTPFFADQPYWARTVYQLGVGPQPIPRKQLTAERLAAAIDQAVNDQEMRARAAALGERIRAEDGVGEAVRLIEGCLVGKLAKASAGVR